MNLRPWRRDAPLFLRIFAWMLGGVAAIQLISILLVLLLPPPEPRVFTLEQVATVLRAGRDASGVLIVTRKVPDPPTPDTLHPRFAMMQTHLAQRLGVPEDRVALRRERPPRVLLFQSGPPGPMPMVFEGPPGGAGGSDVLRARFDMLRDARAELLFGDFAASLQLADGSWRTARSTRAGSVDFWRYRALMWLVAATLAMAPIAWILSRRLARPIALFSRAADRLGRDPRAPPLEVEGPPEIAEAAAAFNEMQARLQRYVEDRSMLTAAIAHDLRTPLMRLSLRLESAPEPLRTATENDIRDMEAMISAVLGFLRDLSAPISRQRLDLRSLVESVTDGFADRGDAVTLAAGDGLVIDGDRPGLKAVVGNLVGNAVAYAGGAEVELGADEREAWVQVSDRGPGLPPDMLERVFQPFFRMEQSRNRATGGVGLGLASARAVARAHGGDVTLENRPGGGLVARLSLPR